MKSIQSLMALQQLVVFPAAQEWSTDFWSLPVGTQSQSQNPSGIHVASFSTLEDLTQSHCGHISTICIQCASAIQPERTVSLVGNQMCALRGYSGGFTMVYQGIHIHLRAISQGSENQMPVDPETFPGSLRFPTEERGLGTSFSVEVWGQNAKWWIQIIQGDNQLPSVTDTVKVNPMTKGSSSVLKVYKNVPLMLLVASQLSVLQWTLLGNRRHGSPRGLSASPTWSHTSQTWSQVTVHKVCAQICDYLNHNKPLIIRPFLKLTIFKKLR